MNKAPIIRRIERRNCWVLTLLVTGSALFLSFHFALGVSIGGVLSILSFQSLQGLIPRLIHLPPRRARMGIVLYHYGRIGLLFGILTGIMALDFVSPIALLLGLSVVVMNLLLTTVIDFRKIKLEV